MVFLTLNYILLRIYNLKLIYGNILSTNKVGNLNYETK